MTTAPSVNIIDKYKHFQGRVKTASAEKTGWKPDAGRFVCSLDRVLVQDDKFTWKLPDPGGELDAVGIMFAYTILDDNLAKTKETFNGRYVKYPDVDQETLQGVFGPEPPAEKGRKAQNDGEKRWFSINIANGQFKGALATLRGIDAETIDNPMAELAVVINEIESRKAGDQDPITVDIQVLHYAAKDRNTGKETGETRFDREKILKRLN